MEIGRGGDRTRMGSITYAGKKVSEAMKGATVYRMTIDYIK